MTGTRNPRGRGDMKDTRSDKRLQRRMWSIWSDKREVASPPLRRGGRRGGFRGGSDAPRRRECTRQAAQHMGFLTEGADCDLSDSSGMNVCAKPGLLFYLCDQRYSFPFLSFFFLSLSRPFYGILPRTHDSLVVHNQNNCWILVISGHGRQISEQRRNIIPG